MVVELEEVFVIRSRQTMSFDWCDKCGDQVHMVTPDQAATITGIGSRYLYRSIEAGRIHFNETSEGHLLICQRSLLEREREGDDFDS